jgi:hypothetical protein
MTYEEIAAKYKERFRNRKAKKAGSIKVYVNNIKRLEAATSRKYLQGSGGRPENYRIHKEFVEFQRTAVILLEADKGYRLLNPSRPLEMEIRREDFEQYIFNRYGWDRSFVNRRVKDASDSEYFGLPELEAGRQFIVVKDRFNHDLEYFKLVVEDYFLEQQQENPTSTAAVNLSDLIALYIPSKKKGANN